MQSFISLILLLSLAAIVSCQLSQGYPGGGGSRQKPGSCYRPGGYGNGRYRRSVSGDDVHEKKVEKRQYQPFAAPVSRGFGGSQGGNGIIGSGGSQGGNGIIGGGGSQGGNGWGNTRRCYQDYDCQGNKKCCNGNCQTPAFVG